MALETDAITTHQDKIRQQQSTGSILMVTPMGFAFNEEAAKDNAFMSRDASKETVSGEKSVLDLSSKALHDFHNLHSTLVNSAGVQVHLFENNPTDWTPDAVFPNNWFTTHAADSDEKHSLVLYPMKSENRRRERKQQVIEFLKQTVGDKGLLDLTPYEKEGKFLEGTGSLVLDRIGKIAYISQSERSNIDIAEIWAKKMGYVDVIHFKALDSNNLPIYHTNVLMSIGTHFAILCLDAIPSERDRNAIMDVLSRDRTVIPISLSQMSSFCGNALELKDSNGLPILCMSTQAYNAFSSEQLQILQRHVARIHHASINTIERVGGGSVRCTIAELF